MSKLLIITAKLEGALIWSCGPLWTLSIPSWLKQQKKKHLSVLLVFALTPVGTPHLCERNGRTVEESWAFWIKGTFIRTCGSQATPALGDLGSWEEAEWRDSAKDACQSGPTNSGKFQSSQLLPTPGSWSSEGNPQKGSLLDLPFHLQGASALPLSGDTYYAVTLPWRHRTRWLWP